MMISETITPTIFTTPIKYHYMVIESNCTIFDVDDTEYLACNCMKMYHNMTCKNAINTTIFATNANRQKIGILSEPSRVTN